MNERFSSGEQGKAPFFVVEDCGEFAVLRFSPHLPGYMTDLSETNRLWDVLSGCRGGLNKKVLLLITMPDSFSPAAMDEFWGHVRCDQTKMDSTTGGSLAAVEMAREENACRHFVEIIRNLDSFVITALEGECDFCFLGEALACDYRIASQDAVFVNNLFQSKTMPGVLPWFLTRFLGQAAAADILLEGRSLTASEAYELKLVNKLAPPGNLEQVSLNTARRFAAIPGPALRAVKRSLVASAEDLNVYLDKIGTGFQFVQRPHTNEMW